MSPKYRYDPRFASDDASDPRRDKTRIKKKAARSDKDWQPTPLEETNATVAMVLPKQCWVRMDQNNAHDVLCNYRRAKVFKPEGMAPRERSPVTVGDRVKVELIGKKDGIVEGVAERKNQILRPAPGREDSVIHVIAANVDLLVIVAAAVSPRFSPGLIDRYLVAAAFAGVPALVCINKVDLKSDDSDPSCDWAIYKKLGIELFEVSAKTGVGIELLRDRLLSRCVVFCGHSGVGKTSLLRKLTGQEVGEVGSINEVTQKGKHTTTGTVLLRGPQGAQGPSSWIDTPGVRSFGLVGITPESVKEFFPELQDLPCTESGCQHMPAEIEAGTCRALPQNLPRLESYQRIVVSLLTEIPESEPLE